MAGHLPLNALRVFEACARHGSFLKAADELAITPGAVSRHIKGLEAELEVRLFDRFNRAVRLTEPGEQLAVGVRQGMATLQGAVEQVRTRRAGPLVVSVGHSLAAKWLAPRLHLFEERHPDVPVLIWASDTVVDLARDGVDIAIRNGRGPYPQHHVTPFIKAMLIPVCHPDMAQRLGPIGKPADFAAFPLVHDFQTIPGEPAWPEYFAAIGAEGVDPRPGAQFSNTYLTVEAAMTGRGAALADWAMVLDDLAAGRLVQMYDFVLPNPYGHWILTQPETADQRNIRRFRTWLLDQAQADGVPLIE